MSIEDAGILAQAGAKRGSEVAMNEGGVAMDYTVRNTVHEALKANPEVAMRLERNRKLMIIVPSLIIIGFVVFILLMPW